MLLQASRINRNISENLTARFKHALMADEILAGQRRTEEMNRLGPFLSSIPGTIINLD